MNVIELIENVVTPSMMHKVSFLNHEMHFGFKI